MTRAWWLKYRQDGNVYLRRYTNLDHLYVRAARLVARGLTVVVLPIREAMKRPGI